jgi:hypothetical protein
MTTLRDCVRELIVHIRLPRTKNIEEAVNLFMYGARVANWTSSTANSYTNRFPNKQKNRKYHYIWLLCSEGLQYCTTCDSVLELSEFHSNTGKRTGKDSKCKSCISQYQRDNKEIYCNNSANYKAAKLRAIPLWADLSSIKGIYLKCPTGHHVDHIVPLRGGKVCGLHVENNLQYLTAEENLKKSNYFDV